jgi:hypothetical protein
MDVSVICKGLRVSDSYVSKWKIVYEKEGAEGLLIKYNRYAEMKKYLEEINK